MAKTCDLRKSFRLQDRFPSQKSDPFDPITALRIFDMTTNFFRINNSPGDKIKKLRVAAPRTEALTSLNPDGKTFTGAFDLGVFQILRHIDVCHNSVHHMELEYWRFILLNDNQLFPVGFGSIFKNEERQWINDRAHQFVEDTPTAH